MINKILNRCQYAHTTLNKYRQKLVLNRDKNLKLIRDIKYGNKKH